MMSQLHSPRRLPAAFLQVARQSMNLCRIAVACSMLCGALIAFQSTPLAAEGQDGRDGQHDFDFEIGTWTTKLSLLQRPLTGSGTWVEYEGTSVVSKVWDGRANLVELKVDGPSGSIEGLSLRLYNPETRQWSLNFANSRDGIMTNPVHGEFREGRGVFHGTDTLNGRAVLVRFVISQISGDSWRFEQSLSDDGGETWESNWIAIDTRVPGEAGD